MYTLPDCMCIRQPYSQACFCSIWRWTIYLALSFLYLPCEKSSMHNTRKAQQVKLNVLLYKFHYLSLDYKAGYGLFSKKNKTV